ncbi:MAG: FKBP-type peptidyl-prolyl cis-trans isomerase [Sporocytophaga sp.]|uniref:FKBP-type peptidyl-prolyl cis-trans isomerase n=1 Tax=Sporocytophaga sp. TaxID=2231183 RepID=UPI001B1D3996|nr:FKBP-type peptidyl-prolyl cis-trans isomerase [Sporocytophaga sp.]MBO9698714.1 FKBP-type peptidyl-prolyl cis-trans isomerase [Sporocytophaga sp.]
MLKKSVAAVGLCILAASGILSSCDGYKKTENGLKYKIVKDSTGGKNIEVGSVALVQMSYKNEKDTFSTAKQNYGNPIDILVSESPFKGSLEEGLVLLSEGDSAIFLVSSDSLYQKRFNTQMPKEIKPGSFTTFNVKVVKVYTKKEVAAEREKYRKQQQEMNKQQMAMVDEYITKMLDSASVKGQLATDQAIIDKKLKAEGITAQRTKHGVSYLITKDADSPLITKGDTVTVEYTGKLLDGTTFDSSVGKDPFTVVVGLGRVIPGWEDALQVLGKGDKATIFIPSPLGYGKTGVPDPANKDKYLIPKNSPLVFDIEVLDVKK